MQICCPHCNNFLAIENSKAPRVVACSICRQNIQIPGVVQVIPAKRGSSPPPPLPSHQAAAFPPQPSTPGLPIFSGNNYLFLGLILGSIVLALLLFVGMSSMQQKISDMLPIKLERETEGYHLLSRTFEINQTGFYRFGLQTTPNAHVAITTLLKEGGEGGPVGLWLGNDPQFITHVDAGRYQISYNRTFGSRVLYRITIKKVTSIDDYGEGGLDILDNIRDFNQTLP